MRSAYTLNFLDFFFTLYAAYNVASCQLSTECRKRREYTMHTSIRNLFSLAIVLTVICAYSAVQVSKLDDFPEEHPLHLQLGGFKVVGPRGLKNPSTSTIEEITWGNVASKHFLHDMGLEVYIA